MMNRRILHIIALFVLIIMSANIKKDQDVVYAQYNPCNDERCEFIVVNDIDDAGLDYLCEYSINHNEVYLGECIKLWMMKCLILLVEFVTRTLQLSLIRL